MIRPVLRMCAVAALREKTSAGDRVYDSDNSPLIDKLTAETHPYITVFTDNDNRMELEGMDLYSTQRNLSLSMEFGLASAITADGKTNPTIHIPYTDQAFEAFVDIMESQIVAALVGDPSSQWGEILKQIVTRVYRMSSRRGGSSDRGTRWAARQLTLVCQTIGDPIPGYVLSSSHPIRQFIALARDTDGMGPAADLIETMLENVNSPDYRKVQSWLGLSQRGIEATGVAPLPQGEEQPIPFDSEDSTVEWDESLDTTTPGPPESFP